MPSKNSFQKYKIRFSKNYLCWFKFTSIEFKQFCLVWDQHQQNLFVPETLRKNCCQQFTWPLTSMQQSCANNCIKQIFLVCHEQGPEYTFEIILGMSENKGTSTCQKLTRTIFYLIYTFWSYPHGYINDCIFLHPHRCL